jgi:hypothetical protein
MIINDTFLTYTDNETLTAAKCISKRESFFFFFILLFLQLNVFLIFLCPMQNGCFRSNAHFLFFSDEISLLAFDHYSIRSDVSFFRLLYFITFQKKVENLKTKQVILQLVTV